MKNEFGALAVTLNGPRHWVINGATGASLPADAKIASFGSLQMLRAATIQSAIGEAAVDNSPYSPIEVQRTNTFNFTTDNEVYELVTDTGETYIMQSYSRIIDVDQSIDDLASLGTRLTLPQGWMFRARVLQDDFDLVTDGLAVVVVDDLSNTYQLIP